MFIRTNSITPLLITPNSPHAPEQLNGHMVIFINRPEVEKKCMSHKISSPTYKPFIVDANIAKSFMKKKFTLSQSNHEDDHIYKVTFKD